MANFYRIEELTTEGWTLIEDQAAKVTKEKCDELLIVSLEKTSTELPTVFNDCGVFPGEITMIGILSSANRLLDIKNKTSILVNILFSISTLFYATANFALQN